MHQQGTQTSGHPRLRSINFTTAHSLYNATREQEDHGRRRRRRLQYMGLSNNRLRFSCLGSLLSAPPRCEGASSALVFSATAALVASSGSAANFAETQPVSSPGEKLGVTIDREKSERGARCLASRHNLLDFSDPSTLSPRRLFPHKNQRGHRRPFPIG